MTENLPLILKKQKSYFSLGNTRAAEFRINQLEKLQSLLVQYEPELLDALFKDFRKPAFEAAISEIYILHLEFNHLIRNVKKWMRPSRVKTSILHPFSHSRIYPEPVGSVLILAPWNYPVQLLLSPLAGAMAAGNCAVLKPSEFAPHSAETMAKIINSHFPPEYIFCATGGKKTATALLAEPFDYIFFTGSKNTGTRVVRASAPNITPVTLELGGKSPCIIDSSVNIRAAARRVVWGKFFNAGQTCVAPDYIYIHISVKNLFVQAMKETLEEFYGKNPQNSPDYARIINQHHFHRLTGLLNSSKIVYGGVCDEEDLYIAPTLLDRVTWHDRIMEQEIFGPILPMLDFRLITEVIEVVNTRPKPLALYLFSKNRKLQKKVIREISAGGVTINDTIRHLVNLRLPFGGVGESGIGSYHGQASFKTFSHYKSIMFRSLVFAPDFHFPPYRAKMQYLKKSRRWLKLIK